MSSWVDSVLDSKLSWTDPGPLGVERLSLMMLGYTEVEMLVSEVEGEKADDNDPGHSIRLFTNMVQDITNRSADLCIRRNLS
jgi:hypothetical protein